MSGRQLKPKVLFLGSSPDSLSMLMTNCCLLLLRRGEHGGFKGSSFDALRLLRTSGVEDSSELPKHYKELNVWQRSFQAEIERMLKALIQSL